jgi:peptide chain release factor 1
MINIDKAYIDRRLARLPELETELSDPATAANQKKYRECVREHNALKRLEAKAQRFLQLQNELTQNQELLASPDVDEELKELAGNEMTTLEPALQAAQRDLLLTIIPPDENERRGAIMEIRAGTGGEEAALFAADIFRMYSRFAAAQGWKISLIDASASGMGGYKDIVFDVEGENVYGMLRYESGVHRVQRVPVTEGSGRVHTSAATVAVFPEAEEDDDIEIKPDEIRIDVFCSSGPGGQSVNTTYSAVRITHLPTGTVAQSQDERSQQRNREKAMKVLKSRLLDVRRQEEEARKGNSRRSQIGTGDRSERIRTYNFPQNRLTDHRINLTLYSLNILIEGDITELLSALRAHDMSMRLAAEVGGAGVD